MIGESKLWIEGALASQKQDGWFGPDKGRKGEATDLEGREDLWPNMIMLFCLQDYYDFTGDQRVIALMTKYMKYLTTVPEDRFLVGYWPKMRGGDLLYSVYWLYNRTGEKSLLELAGKVHRTTAAWQDDVINWHNVNMSQGFGEPARFYMQSYNPAHLEAADRNWTKIREMYGQVPGGMVGGDENCRPGYTGPRQGVETCGMVEMMLSHETLLTISGDPKWADRCEDVAFNSLPAAFTPDLKALHYLTAPNLILCDSQNKSQACRTKGRCSCSILTFIAAASTTRACMALLRRTSVARHAGQRPGGGSICTVRGDSQGRRRHRRDNRRTDPLPLRGQHRIHGQDRQARSIPPLFAHPRLVQDSRSHDERKDA